MRLFFNLINEVKFFDRWISFQQSRYYVHKNSIIYPATSDHNSIKKKKKPSQWPAPWLQDAVCGRRRWLSKSLEVARRRFGPLRLAGGLRVASISHCRRGLSGWWVTREARELTLLVYCRWRSDPQPQWAEIQNSASTLARTQLRFLVLASTRLRSH